MEGRSLQTLRTERQSVAQEIDKLRSKLAQQKQAHAAPTQPHGAACRRKALDEKVEQLLDTQPQDQRDGQAPTPEGVTEKVCREARVPPADLNSAASAAISPMAKVGCVKAGASANDRIIRQLQAALKTETDAIARKFLKALVREVKARA